MDMESERKQLRSECKAPKQAHKQSTRFHHCVNKSIKRRWSYSRTAIVIQRPAMMRLKPTVFKCWNTTSQMQNR